MTSRHLKTLRHQPAEQFVFLFLYEDPESTKLIIDKRNEKFALVHFLNTHLKSNYDSNCFDNIQIYSVFRVPKMI